MSVSISMKQKMKYILLLTLLVSSFFMMGCKNGRTSSPQYQPKYSEANLVGEWIRKDRVPLPKDGNGLEKEYVIEDTLIFGYNNDVVSKQKTIYHYTNFHSEEMWGEHEVLTGKYKMINDTLTVTLDYPNIMRTTFSKDSLSLTPTVHIDGKDSISSYYAVRDLSGQSFTLVYYLRKWKGGSSQIDNKEFSYKRR